MGSRRSASTHWNWQGGRSPSPCRGRTGPWRNPTATIDQLAEVAVRYTVGFGALEHLLSDDRVEDIYVDAPCASVPVHVTLGGVSGSSSTVRAETNLLLSDLELQALIARLRYYSRRPFSEAFPVLETDVPGFDSRATLVGQPLSPHGPALALRRHSRKAWTLLRLVQNGTLTAQAAGLISFLVDGRCSMLVCGPRGAGKSSLLSAVMFELPPSQRVLAIEDTLELPVRKMQELGYRAQSLLIEGGLDKGVDQAAEEALRVSLRLGESALVMGEVRGREAATLYESMRTGKAGSAVLGTIHGDSARSVYERVVHDMGIAPEAFSATDVILSLALTRPLGSHRQVRRLSEVAALAKERGPGQFDQMLDALNGGKVEGGCEVIGAGGRLLGDRDRGGMGQHLAARRDAASAGRGPGEQLPGPGRPGRGLRLQRVPLGPAGAGPDGTGGVPGTVPREVEGDGLMGDRVVGSPPARLPVGPAEGAGLVREPGNGPGSGGRLDGTQRHRGRCGPLGRLHLAHGLLLASPPFSPSCSASSFRCSSCSSPRWAF